MISWILYLAQSVCFARRGTLGSEQEFAVLRGQMPVKIQDDCEYKKLNGAMTGHDYRQWEASFLDEASGFTDESSSSMFHRRHVQ